MLPLIEQCERCRAGDPGGGRRFGGEPGAGLARRARRWAEATGFKAEPGQIALLPGRGRRPGAGAGRLEAGGAALGAGGAARHAAGTRLRARRRAPEAATPSGAGLGARRLCLHPLQGAQERLGEAGLAGRRPIAALVERLADGIFLARDLINTPTEDMGPAELAAAAEDCSPPARRQPTASSSATRCWTQNYPTIHAVGRAAAGGREPRLIDFTWGDRGGAESDAGRQGRVLRHRRARSEAGERHAADEKRHGRRRDHARARRTRSWRRSLPVRLRVLVPAVENSVAGNAIRPLDIVKTRKGLTVEIGNTDAEGRLILCDALAEADSEKAGAAGRFRDPDRRRAHRRSGPDLPALFANDDDARRRISCAPARAQVRSAVAPAAVARLSRHVQEQRSPISTMSRNRRSPARSRRRSISRNSSRPRRRGRISIPMPGTQKSRPGRPEGGEALGLRAPMP